MSDKKFLNCHYHEPNFHDFESCPVRLHASDAITDECIYCPYNTFGPDASSKFLLIRYREKLQRIAKIIEDVDERCLAVDGDVPETLQEMTESEIKEIYDIASIPIGKMVKEPNLKLCGSAK